MARRADRSFNGWARALIDIAGARGGALGGENGTVADLVPAGREPGWVWLHVDVDRLVAADETACVPGGSGRGHDSEGVGRRVDVEEERAHPRRVVGGRAVHHAAVDEDDGARGPAELASVVGGEGGYVAWGDGPRPVPVIVELVEDGPAMGARQRSERALLGARVLQIDPEGEDGAVGVRPRLDVLVPANGVAALGPLEVELRAVEANVRPEEIGTEVNHGGIRRELPELGMLVHRLAQAADVGLLRGVIRSKVELIVGGGEGSRFLDLGRYHRTEALEPGRAHVARHGEEAVLEVALALPRREHEGCGGQDLFWRHGYCARAPPSTTSSLPVM